MPAGVNNKELGIRNRETVHELLQTHGKDLTYEQAEPMIRKILGRSMSQNTFIKYRDTFKPQSPGRRVASNNQTPVLSDEAKTAAATVLELQRLAGKVGGLDKLKVYMGILEESTHLS